MDVHSLQDFLTLHEKRLLQLILLVQRLSNKDYYFFNGFHHKIVIVYSSGVTAELFCVRYDVSSQSDESSIGVSHTVDLNCGLALFVFSTP